MLIEGNLERKMFGSLDILKEETFFQKINGALGESRFDVNLVRMHFHKMNS
jgi:hypothetical protein